MNPPAETTSREQTAVLTVAFVGKRALLDGGPEDADRLASLQAALTTRLHRLAAEWKPAPPRQVVGLSSLAVGGDMLFTRACRTLGWPQHILLPQPREGFLQAAGSSGPDFSPAEADEARQLLASPHVVEERVASTSPDRHTRFEDVNRTLVDACDLLVCLLPAATTTGKRGGSLEAAALAHRRHRPVLELRVHLNASHLPVLTEAWLPPPTATPAR
jgi:hypothetical protein